MAQTIHDLFREIDKVIEQVRAMGAREEHLSLKLPRAALPDFRQMCGVNNPAVMAPSKYRDIPITEWTDGPFMSFSLDHSVSLHDEARPVVLGDPMKSGGIVESWSGRQYLVGERGPEPIMPIKRTLTEEEGACEPVSVTINFPEGLTRADQAWSCPACGGKERGYALRCAKCFPGSFFAKAISDAATKIKAQIGRSRCVINPDDFVYGDGSPLSEADKRALFGKRRSVISAMMSARRARARKAKALTPETESVHRAISAMQKPGRANEL